MDRVKCLPLERGKGIDQPSQKLVEKKLKDGKLVHIFPEGTRSRTGKLLPGKGGVGKRIYETKVKVVPCFHSGIRDILPVGTYFPKMGKKVKIIIGEPITFEDLFQLENVPETWRKISQRIMDRIAELRDEVGE
jgi:1-acyl-sn-glycerol-3-phosphate acyltransferase